MAPIIHKQVSPPKGVCEIMGVCVRKRESVCEGERETVCVRARVCVCERERGAGYMCEARAARHDLCPARVGLKHTQRVCVVRQRFARDLPAGLPLSLLPPHAPPSLPSD